MARFLHAHGPPRLPAPAPAPAPAVVGCSHGNPSPSGPVALGHGGCPCDAARTHGWWSETNCRVSRAPQVHPDNSLSHATDGTSLKELGVAGVVMGE